jgi:hypothetical protein
MSNPTSSIRLHDDQLVKAEEKMKLKIQWALLWTQYEAQHR